MKTFCIAILFCLMASCAPPAYDINKDIKAVVKMQTERENAERNVEILMQAERLRQK